MNLFPERIDTDRLTLEALSTETVDPLTLYEYASSEFAAEVTAHLLWDPHDHPKESLDAIRDAEKAREAGERAGAMIELAFDRLDLDVVAVPHMDGNEKSRRAVEKYVERFGGQREGLLWNFQVNDDGTVVDMHRYTITREQYDRTTRTKHE